MSCQKYKKIRASTCASYIHLQLLDMWYKTWNCLLNQYHYVYVRRRMFLCYHTFPCRRWLPCQNSRLGCSLALLRTYVKPTKARINKYIDTYSGDIRIPMCIVVKLLVPFWACCSRNKALSTDLRVLLGFESSGRLVSLLWHHLKRTSWCRVIPRRQKDYDSDSNDDFNVSTLDRDSGI